MIKIFFLLVVFVLLVGCEKGRPPFGALKITTMVNENKDTLYQIETFKSMFYTVEDEYDCTWEDYDGVDVFDGLMHPIIIVKPPFRFKDKILAEMKMREILSIRDSIGKTIYHKTK
jgi:hypothetical protein